MSIINKIISLSNEYEDYVLNIRRRIHENPELSFKEYETSKLVISELKKIGLDVTGDIAGTGILASLKGKREGKVLLIRGDMDALPIEEEVDLKFKSKNKGVMHACGHDVHTANLLGLAKILAQLKDEIRGTVKFIFQPGEEKGGGGRKMIEEGILLKPKVDMALALHIMPIKAGDILLSKGNITASSDGFTIKIFGRASHTSRPQDGVDAINIAGSVISSLNTIISKNIDPRDSVTFSIGKIQGGTYNNIVPDYVELKGMIRSLDREARDIVIEKIKSVSEGIATTFGGSCEVEIREGYPSVVNNSELTDILRTSFKENLKVLSDGISDSVEVINHRPLLTADDFGYISQEIPSVYYMVGTGDYAAGHSPNFYVDEKYIKLCTRTMALAAWELLK